MARASKRREWNDKARECVMIPLVRRGGNVCPGCLGHDLHGVGRIRPGRWLRQWCGQGATLNILGAQLAICAGSPTGHPPVRVRHTGVGGPRRHRERPLAHGELDTYHAGGRVFPQLALLVTAPAVYVATSPHRAGVVVPRVERDRLEAGWEPGDQPGPLVVVAGRGPAELALVVEPPAGDAPGVGDGTAEGVPHGRHLGLPNGGQVNRVVDFIATPVEVEVRGDGGGVEGVGPTKQLVVPREAVLVGVEVQPVAAEGPCVEDP